MPTQHQFDFGSGLVSVPMAASRATDPHTSVEAARQVEASGVAGAQRTACLAEVRRNPGLTAAEIAANTGLERHVPSRRLPELRTAGLVTNGEARSCRVTGNKSLTWLPA